MPKNNTHDWLSLVSMSGLVVSEPVLAEAFPGGPERVPPRWLQRLPREWERFRLNKGADPQGRWLDFILHDLLELGLQRGHHLRKSSALPPQTRVTLLEVSQMLSPSRALVDDLNRPLLLINITPPGQSLDRPETVTGRWKASPYTKMDRLLRESGAPLGLLTNGLDWRLVYPASGITAHLTWSGQGWLDERLTLDAFFSLLRADRFQPGGTALLQLIRESQTRQIDVADQLGEQVRAAVGLFVQALDAGDRASGGDLLAGLSLAQVYELSLGLMMRLVFILYAEENHLLPHGEVLYDRAYGLTYLTARLEQERRQQPDTFQRAGDAWGQLLATFRLIFYGSPHPDLSLRPYGGQLFDPDRYGRLLEDPRLRLSNAAVYAILRQLTLARAKLGREVIAQRVSYRSFNEEQIGYVYEGLLDHQLARAGEEPLLQLKTPKDMTEAVVSLAAVEARPPAERPAFLAQASRRDESVIANELEAGAEPPEPDELADLRDELGAELAARAAPYRRVMVSGGVIPPDHLYVTAGQSRRAMGAHYTPPELTAPIVATTLGPLVYERFEVVEDEPQRREDREEKINEKSLRPSRLGGETEQSRLSGGGNEPQRREDREEKTDENPLRPLRLGGESKPAARWVGTGLKSPRDILNLKVCDMAMGSGAFLVQACRYLAERLVEAWDQLEVQLNETGNEPQRREDRQENIDENPLRPLRLGGEIEPSRLSGETGEPPRREDRQEKIIENPLRPLRLGGESKIQITPFGEVSTARPQERLLPAGREERLTLARRLVAERCLYGVDKNPLAVEMARLSLWITTLAKDRPFTFLNHALKGGDSLVGVDADRLLRWATDADTPAQTAFFYEDLATALKEAVALRRELTGFSVVEPEDIERKAALHLKAETALARLRLAGDLIIGAHFAEPEAKARAALLAHLLAVFADLPDSGQLSAVSDQPTNQPAN